MNTELEEQMRRLRNAKRAIHAIANAGPRFLYGPASDRIGQLMVDRYGQTWYVDAFTGLMMYPFEGHAWRGFSAGPEQKSIVMALANYVRNGHQVDLALIAQACAEPYGDAWPGLRADLVTLEAITQDGDTHDPEAKRPDETHGHEARHEGTDQDAVQTKGAGRTRAGAAGPRKRAAPKPK